MLLLLLYVVVVVVVVDVVVVDVVVVLNTCGSVYSRCRWPLGPYPKPETDSQSSPCSYTWRFIGSYK